MKSCELDGNKNANHDVNTSLCTWMQEGGGGRGKWKGELGRGSLGVRRGMLTRSFQSLKGRSDIIT